MIFYDNDEYHIREHVDMYIEKIMIDMSGWCEGDDDDMDLIKKGTYPYIIDFRDAAKEPHRAAVDGYKSGNFKALMDDMGNRYHGLVNYNTRVEIIIPQSITTKMGYDSGFINQCQVEELGQIGMDAIRIKLPDDGKLQARLQTCLDEVVHTAWLNCHTIDTPQDILFPQSINHYEYTPEARAEIWPEYYTG